MASSKRPRAGAKSAPKPPKPPASPLAVRVDGKDLPEPEARALWSAFSEAMESSRGDTAAFAATRGYASASPTYEKGRAVLVIKTLVLQTHAADRSAADDGSRS